MSPVIKAGLIIEWRVRRRILLNKGTNEGWSGRVSSLKNGKEGESGQLREHHWNISITRCKSRQPVEICCMAQEAQIWCSVTIPEVWEGGGGGRGHMYTYKQLHVDIQAETTLYCESNYPPIKKVKLKMRPSFWFMLMHCKFYHNIIK